MNAREFGRRYAHLKRLIDRRLGAVVTSREPRDLAEACRYVLSAGGKRVRSVLVLLGCEAVGGDIRQAIDAGIAVELLHNFTLVHDDVMDNAPSRRGRPTVHTKWNVNNALLVGDVVVSLAYRSLLKTRTKDPRRICELFTNCFVDVCEGQALDLAFERKTHVSVSDYYRMIDKKTGRMIATATELGARIGNGTDREAEALRRFGRNLGRAFQLQDDLLDVVADEKEFGKTIGGDIVAGKKTFLLLKAIERATGKDKRTLNSIIKTAGRPDRRTVEKVTAIYHKYGVIDEARQQIRQTTATSLAELAVLQQNRGTRMLQWFSELLLRRVS